MPLATRLCPATVALSDSSKCVGSLVVKVIVGLVAVEGTLAPRLMPPAVSNSLPTFWALTVIVGAVTVAVICVADVGSVLKPEGVLMEMVLVPAVAGWKLTPLATKEPLTVKVSTPVPVMVPTEVVPLVKVTLTDPPACGPKDWPQFDRAVTAEFHAHSCALNAVGLVAKVFVVKLLVLISTPEGRTVIVAVPLLNPDTLAVRVTACEPGPTAKPCPCR